MSCKKSELRQAFTTRRDFITTGSALVVLASTGTWGPKVAMADQKNSVVIRGHHLFDMLDALGTGRSAHKTLGPVAMKIRRNPDILITLVVGADDICSPCEWWDHKQSLCTKSLKTYPRDNEESLISDRNALRALGAKTGDMVRAKDLYRLIKAKVNKRVFAEEVCVACRLVDRCKETYEAQIDAAVKALTEPQV